MAPNATPVLASPARIAIDTQGVTLDGQPRAIPGTSAVLPMLRRAAFVVALALMVNTPGRACTVFFAFDGKLAIAGDNEDWADPNTQMWFVPPTRDNYGIVYFGFGKGEYPEGGVSSHRLRIPEKGITSINPEELCGLPQGGMNEKGLFLGGAATDVVHAPPAPGKKAYDGR